MSEGFLGHRIKLFRDLAGISQAELARRAGIPRPVISKLESGRQIDIGTASARKIASALGISLDMLVGDGEKLRLPPNL